MNRFLGRRDRRSTRSAARLAFTLLPCLGLLVSSASLSAGNGRRPGRDLRFDVAGGPSSTQVLVRITPGLALALKTAAPKNKFGTPVAADSPRLSRTLRRTLVDWQASGMTPVFAEGFAHPELARKYGLDRFYTISVPAGTDTPALAAAVAGSAEEIEAAEAAAIGEVAEVFPTDPEFSRQWSLYNTGEPNTGTSTDTCPDGTSWCAGVDIRAPEAWEITTGSPDVIIAIIDSGVSPHSEFGDRLLVGRNTVNNSTSTADGCPHGTHVAGIAAAGANNGIVLCPNPENPDAICGMVGVNWNAKILPVKVLTGCSGGVTDVAEGITWAVDNGASVLNISLQFYNLSGLNRVLMENALNYAVDAGALVIAAAGNGLIGGAGVVAHPAAMPQAIAVSATGACDQFCTNATCGWNSNWGPEVEIAAPGDDIYSTLTGNSYACNFGTSMATPHVVGVASLVKSLAPELTNISIRNILASSALDLGEPGRDELYGYGRLDAYGALLTTQTWPQMLRTDPPSDSIDARRPHLPNNPFAQEGWQSLRALFRGDAAGLTRDDFVVDAGVSSPTIAGVTFDQDAITIALDRPIPVRSWTVIRHPLSGTGTRLGYLPGDVNGDRITNEADLSALEAHLASTGGGSGGGSTSGESALPIWSTDINRSGKTTPADLLELIDLMNGAGAYDRYKNVTLPPPAD